MGLDISKIVNAELKQLAFLKDKNNNGKLEDKEFSVFKSEAATKGVTAEDFNQAMGLYQSNPIKAKENDKKEKVEREKASKADTGVSKKNINHHKDSIKETLEKLEDANYLYTTKEDLANALKEKFPNKEYESLHADVEQVLKFVPEFNNKDDVKNIEKTVKKHLKMNGFQKDVLNAVVEFAKNAQIQKELDAAIALYDEAKAANVNNVNYEAAYKTAKKQIAKGSYDNEVKDLLEKHAKADALAHVDALAVANKTAVKEKAMKKALRANIDKKDDFMKDAIKNEDNIVEIAVRRNKLQNREINLAEISGKEIEKELGYDLYQKLRQNFIAEEKENYDITALADVVKNRIGSDVLVRINDDLPMSELENIRKDFEAIVKDSLTNKETKKILELVRAEIKEKDRSLSTAARKGLDGIFPGLVGALSASRVLNVKQNVTLVCGSEEAQEFLGQLSQQGIKPAVTELENGEIKVDIKQEVFQNHLALNALIGMGVGFASRVLAALIFGEADYERSCVSIADFDPQDPTYTNLDNYKKYLQERLPKAKADILIKIAENCKNEKGEFDKAQFDSLMKHIAGVGSVVTCDELKGHSKGITFDKAEKEVETETPVKKSVVTQGVKAAEAPVYEVVPAIDGSKTSWVQIAGQYDCLAKTYGLNGAIRMLKLAQAVNNGDYSKENMERLYELSKKGLSSMKNVDGIDYEKYKNALLATSLDNKEYDKNGNYIPGTGVKVPDVLADCERNKEKSLAVTQRLTQATGNNVVAPEGHAADKRLVKDGVAGKYGYRINGGKVIVCNDAAELDRKVSQAKAEAEAKGETVTIEKIKTWDEFTK